MATNSPIYWPFPTNTVTEWPGTRPAGWAYHVGTDFGVAQGTPLRATVSGTVYLTWNDGYGAYVLDIVRPDGFVVRNGHLSRMDVPNGSWVNAGDHIGLTGGAKGTPGAGLSTGAHLHWELRWNRNWSGPGWVDPRTLTILSFDSNGGSTPGETNQPATSNAVVFRRRRNGKKTMFIWLKGTTRYAICTPGVKGSWWESILDQQAANALATQYGNAMPCLTDAWNDLKKRTQ